MIAEVQLSLRVGCLAAEAQVAAELLLRLRAITIMMRDSDNPSTTEEPE